MLQHLWSCGFRIKHDSGCVALGKGWSSHQQLGVALANRVQLWSQSCAAVCSMASLFSSLMWTCPRLHLNCVVQSNGVLTTADQRC